MIVPCLNEAGRIGRTVRGIRVHCPDVVVVDDGSSDSTAAESEAAGAVVLRHLVNRGKGASLLTGFRHARERGYTSVITMDGDGQHDPADIPALLAACRADGCEVLVGNRMAASAGMPLVRRVTNRLMSWLLSRSIGQRVPDTQCGYRLYRCAALPVDDVESDRFAAESEILLVMADRGARIGAVPVKTIYGDEKSKIRPVRDTLRFARMLARYRRRKPAERKETRIC